MSRTNSIFTMAWLVVFFAAQTPAKAGCTVRGDIVPGEGPTALDLAIDAPIGCPPWGAPVTIIDPCGIGSNFFQDSWTLWSPSQPGTYALVVPAGSGGINETPSGGAPAVFTFDVTQSAGCGSCNGDGGAVSGTEPRVEATLERGILARFWLGSDHEGKSAGLLRIINSRPESDLGGPASLQYDLLHDHTRPGFNFVPPTGGAWRQIRTSQLLADIQGGSGSYTIRLFALSAITGATTINGYDADAVTNGDEFKKWEVTYDDEAPQLTIVEYDNNGTALILKIRYEYAYDGPSTFGELPYNWTLTTKDASSNVLQTESISWTAPSSSPDPDGAEEQSTYIVKDSADRETLRRVEKFDTDPWLGPRRVYRCIDPAGANLIWRWNYVGEQEPLNPADVSGLMLKWVQRPDGSWTWYNYVSIPVPPADPPTDFTSVDLRIEQISGLKDEPFPTTAPAVDDENVRGLAFTYSDKASGELASLDIGHFRLSALREYVDGHLTRAVDYSWNYIDFAYNPLRALVGDTVEEQWLNQAGTEKLVTTYSHATGDTAIAEGGEQDLTGNVIYPDDRMSKTIYDDAIVFTSATYPDAPAYDAEEPSSSYTNQLHRLRQTTQGVLDEGEFTLVAGKSTRDVLIVDRTGRPVLSEHWVYTTAEEWERVSWSAKEYDARFRLVDSWSSDGQREQIEHPDCCSTREVADAQGVTTVYEYDLLKRPVRITRQQVDEVEVGGVTYLEQPSIETEYDYSGFRSEVITVSAGSLTQATTRAYDGAKRLVSIITGSGAGALKTLYKYEGPTVTGSGNRVTVYHSYDDSAVVGTTGVRDEITDFYADGSRKSVTGAAVTPTFFDHGAATESGIGVTWSSSVTGASASSSRKATTFRDMLGRTIREERPGWPTSAEITLETKSFYDTDGRLARVETPGQADSLYSYDSLGNLNKTALDVDDDGHPIVVSGMNRVTRSETTFEDGPSSSIWEVSRSWVYPIDNDDDEILTSTVKRRLTGLTGGLLSETRSIDIFGKETITTLTRNSANSLDTVTVNDPDSSQNAITIRHGGREEWAISKTGVVTSREYDALGRQTCVTDGRRHRHETFYDASGRVESTEDGAGHVTEYVYYPGDAESEGAYPGQTAAVTTYLDAAEKHTYFGYNGRGQITLTWGDVPYPTEVVYDVFGQRIELHTFRDGTDWSDAEWPTETPDVTTWDYDEATGLLDSKLYEDGSHVDYEYTSVGQLWKRQWARDATTSDVTTYTYDPATGEMTDVTYDAGWSMTNLEFAYDRLGRRTQIDDAAGTRTFSYHPGTLQPTVETFTSGVFDDLRIEQLYADGTGGSVAGRWRGLQIGTVSDEDSHYAATYAYDVVGRLNRVTGPGLYTGGSSDNHGAWYTFLADVEDDIYTDLVARLEFKNAAGDVKGWVDRSFDSDHDLVTAVQNNFGSLSSFTTISQYGYGHDTLDRRTHKQRSGEAYSGSAPWVSHYETYGYNDRNELTGSNYFTGTFDTGTAVTASDHDYTYDPIGNRMSYTAHTSDTPVTEYVSNELNQYERADTRTGTTLIAAQALAYDLDGNLTEAFLFADMNCDGLTDFNDITGFSTALTGQAAYEAAYPTCRWLNADLNADGDVTFDDINDFPSILTSGNGDSLASRFIYDAENRLIEVRPWQTTPQDGQKKVTFKYDYLGRRVEKVVSTYASSAWSVTYTRRFVWNDWLLMLELDGSGNVLRRYSWGLDLSGQSGVPSQGGLTAAGGIGGLLAVQDNNETPSTTGDDLNYVYFFDANGNVGQVVDLAAGSASASIKAKYEYDPYGKVIEQAGDYADATGPANPITFSTKYFDAETALGYWGHRYYSPKLGRWINRDTIEELGGVNLYAYVANAPVGSVDHLGHFPCPAAPPSDSITPPPDAPPPDPCVGAPCPGSKKAILKNGVCDCFPKRCTEGAPPAGGPSPPPPAGAGATCDCKVKRSAICTLDPQGSADFGHEWIDCGGDTWDFPRNYINSPCERVCPDPPVWERNLHVSPVGHLPGGTPCSQATCAQIKECLGKENANAKWDQKNYKFLTHNCVSFTNEAAPKCCLMPGLLPTRVPGIGEEAQRCKERKECHERHPQECQGTP